MGGRVNTIMQTCFFAISGVLPRDEAIRKIKDVDRGDLRQERQGGRREELRGRRPDAREPVRGDGARRTVQHAAAAPVVPPQAPAFVRHVTAMMMAGPRRRAAGQRDCPATAPTRRARADGRNATSRTACRRGSRNSASNAATASWSARTRQSAHATTTRRRCAGAAGVFVGAPRRPRFPEPAVHAAGGASKTARGASCVSRCARRREPTAAGVRAINMDAEGAASSIANAANFAFFATLPDNRPADLDIVARSWHSVLTPLFEYSGACAGCGETPYLRLLTQLFGDRLLVANATGCSSIYGGNLPTTPWAVNKEGRGPAWANSLFEDNAEFGLGYRLALDKHREQAEELLKRSSRSSAPAASPRSSRAPQVTHDDVDAQRRRVAALDAELARMTMRAPHICGRSLSTWCAGASGSSVAMAGPTTSATVGSTTCSRRAATSTFSSWIQRCTRIPVDRRRRRRRAVPWRSSPPRETQPQEGSRADGHGLRQRLRRANRDGGVRPADLDAFLEAEAYEGPSLIIAYGHCIAHGIDMRSGCGSRSSRPIAATGRSTGTGRRPASVLDRSSCSIRRAKDPVGGVRVQRDPLQDARRDESGRCADDPPGCAGRHR